MKRIIKVSVCFYLFVGFISYSSAFGEIDIFEIVSTNGVSEVRAVLGVISDINEKDKNGMTALMWAAWKNPNLEVIKVLIDAGADASLTDNNGNTALDYIKKELNYRKLKSEYYKLLWTRDATFSKESYFVELCGSGTPSEVINAIKGGADVNAVDRYGVSPIFWAAWLNSNVAVISALLESGANPNVSYGGGKTPLIMAAGDNTNPEIIIALLNSGADPNVRDSSGNRAFDYAEGNGAIRNSKAYSMLREAAVIELRSKDATRS